MSARSGVTGRFVRCVVWDLESTLRDGPPRSMYPLDRRGVLHAAVTELDQVAAERYLTSRDIDNLLVALETDGSRPAALRRIAGELDLPLAELAFVGAGSGRVAAALPVVRCYPAASAHDLAAVLPTENTGSRRHRYVAARLRRTAAAAFDGSVGAFTWSLGLELTLRPATPADLAQPFPLRTTDHPATGDECWAADLRDRFGPYGTVALGTLTTTHADAVLDPLAVTADAVRTGAVDALLAHLVTRSRTAGRRPVAHHTPTPANRPLLAALRFAGYAPTGTAGVLSVDPAAPPTARRHPVTVSTPD